METNSTNENAGLSESISKEIVDPTVDLAIEYAELNLDSFLADGIFREIPFLRSLYSGGKIGLAIRERFFVKKLFVFLKEFRSKTISEQNLNDFKFEIDTDSKYRDKITEQIIIFVDSFLSIEKSKIYANLFRAYVERRFSWQHFLHLSSCLISINPKAFEFLQELARYDFKIPEDSNERKIQRDGDKESILSSGGIGYEISSWSSGFNVSGLGKDLFLFGIEPVISPDQHHKEKLRTL